MAPQPGGYGPGQPPGPPLPPGYLPAPPGASKPRGPLIAAIAIALVLVAGLVVGGVVLFGGDSDSDEAGPQPSESVPSSGQPSEGPSEEPSQDAPQPPDNNNTGTPLPEAGREVTDPITGVSLPLLEGWESLGTGNSSTGTGMGRYPCPQDTTLECLHGGVSVQQAVGYQATDVEGIAKEDIAKNAKSSYDPRAYGGITSDKVLKSEAVTVAGQQGYRVRWQVVNKKKPDAYVESVAFTSPSDPGMVILLRFGFDVHDDAPSLADIDTILKGIKVGEPQAPPRDPNEV